jgi:hypothetical protein
MLDIGMTAGTFAKPPPSFLLVILRLLVQLLRLLLALEAFHRLGLAGNADVGA